MSFKKKLFKNYNEIEVNPMVSIIIVFREEKVIQIMLENWDDISSVSHILFSPFDNN